VRRYTWGGVYQSGYINHTTLTRLDHATVYHYAIGHYPGAAQTGVAGMAAA
jgi:hypothetical protein